jgi:muscarinic acetylcholine receptor
MDIDNAEKTLNLASRNHTTSRAVPNNPPVSLSPIISKEMPRSLHVSRKGCHTLTYDILVGHDGADLRYTDESSVIVPFPIFESLPSS